MYAKRKIDEANDKRKEGRKRRNPTHVREILYAFMIPLNPPPNRLSNALDSTSSVLITLLELERTGRLTLVYLCRVSGSDSRSVDYQGRRCLFYAGS